MLNFKLSKPSGLWWLLLSASIFAIDYCSKHWMLTHLNYQEPLEILPFFNFTLAFNKGAAFSMLNAASGWQHWFLGGLSVAVSFGIILYLAVLPLRAVWQCLGLSLILAGALGNLLDRIQYGHVVDFLDFHLGDWHFAIFNIADSAICTGAFLLIIFWSVISKE